MSGNTPRGFYPHRFQQGPTGDPKQMGLRGTIGTTAVMSFRITARTPYSPLCASFGEKHMKTPPTSPEQLQIPAKAAILRTWSCSGGVRRSAAYQQIPCRDPGPDGPKPLRAFRLGFRRPSDACVWLCWLKHLEVACNKMFPPVLYNHPTL